MSSDLGGAEHRTAPAQYKRDLFGAFRAMWVLTLFDLPTTTKQHKREYVKFHDYLLDAGFVMLQFSVYARNVPSPERAKVIEDDLKEHLPPAGEVRVLSLTDQQYARMRLFIGKRKGKVEEVPQQFSFF